MATNQDALERYLKRGTPVAGWLSPYSARVIAGIAAIQRQHNLDGSVGEIGVHRGRLFIVLYLSRWGDQRAFAIDVFDEQHLNVDRSGRGNEAAFLKNVDHWSGAPNQVAVLRKSSLQVTPDEIFSKVGKCRLMSVDGGHTAECAVNDIGLAEAVLDEFGVAIVDDVFNQIWPGVGTGVASYCLTPSTKLRPFAISPNKVYFSRSAMHAFYREQLRSAFPSLFHKTSLMFGCEVDLYGTRPRRALSEQATRFIKRTLKGSGLGAVARALKPLVR